MLYGAWTEYEYEYSTLPALAQREPATILDRVISEQSFFLYD